MRPTYVFASERDHGGDRFAALAELYDRHTIRHLETLGIAPGWRCLEIGAGGGSIARWIAERVRPGSLVATDLDAALLDALRSRGIDSWRHDIAVDSLPERTFDLVHARLVLMHLPRPAEALAKMAAALAPGGWLLVEEFDVASLAGVEAEIVDEPPLATSLAARTIMSRRGVDLGFGRQLPVLFRAHGLDAIGAEGRLDLWTGASAGTRLVRSNYEALLASILGDGHVTPAEVDRDLARLDDHDFAALSPMMWSVWGRALTTRGRRSS
jgi:SAM-dependent methyltransferase